MLEWLAIVVHGLAPGVSTETDVTILCQHEIEGIENQ